VQLEEVEKKLNNLAEAMAQGIFSATTKNLLDDLEAQKKTIETDIIQYQIRNPIVPKEQLLFALYNYRKLDMSVQSDRQKLIDSFVNSIYLYDDHFIITFNYKNTSKKVSLKEINSSPLTSSTPSGDRRIESGIYECGQVHRCCKQVHGSEGTGSRGAQSFYSQSSDPRTRM